MAEQQTHLLSFYIGWDAYQALLIKAIAPLSSEQLALRVAPHLRSIGENVAHIMSGRVSNFHLLMGEGSAELAPLEQWDVPGAPPKCHRVGTWAGGHLADDSDGARSLDACRPGRRVHGDAGRANVQLHAARDYLKTHQT